jgi:methylase of polypeptide subunit release factors
MKPNNLIRYLYRTYDRQGLVFGLYQQLIASKLVVRLLFGVDLSHVPEEYLFDLTTVLLRRVLQPRIDSRKRVLEIGVGRFALLSISLSKSCKVQIDGVEISAQLIKGAEACVARNGGKVTIWQSDVFSNVPPKKYDVIFWNLPYLGPMWGVQSGYDRLSYLHPLFGRVDEYLQPNGELVIGFNASASRITVEQVFDILAGYKSLILREVKTWRWNNHAVLIIGRRGA